MKLKKSLGAFFLAFFLSSSIKDPQDVLYAKVPGAFPKEDLSGKHAGISEGNFGNFVGKNQKFQASSGSKSEMPFYAARGNRTTPRISSPILGNVVSLGRFADFGPNLLPEAPGRRRASHAVSNEKISLSNPFSWADSHKESENLNNKSNQSHPVGSDLTNIGDSHLLSAHGAEEDNLNEILNYPHVQFDLANEPLEQDISTPLPTHGRSRNPSISSMWSNGSFFWDDPEQASELSDSNYEDSDEEDSGFASSSPLFGDGGSPGADLKPFDLDLPEPRLARKGASTQYMDWGAGDLSDSEDEAASVAHKNPLSGNSLTWDDSEQALSFFNEGGEASDEELDLGTEPLFVDGYSPGADLEPFADLDLPEPRLARKGASTQYMNWGTGDLSDSEDEAASVAHKNPLSGNSLTWDDSEQALSFFNHMYEDSGEELDLGTEPLFKNAASIEVALEPLENLSAEEECFLKKTLILAQDAVPAGYMTLCYTDEENLTPVQDDAFIKRVALYPTDEEAYLKAKPRRNSISSIQPKISPKSSARRIAHRRKSDAWEQ